MQRNCILSTRHFKTPPFVFFVVTFFYMHFMVILFHVYITHCP